VSYVLAAYGLAVGGVAAYAAWLARTRRQLERELAGAPQRNDG
jgi:heme exporter protein CcmD